jgi:hypothetical protein
MRNYFQHCYSRTKWQGFRWEKRLSTPKINITRLETTFILPLRSTFSVQKYQFWIWQKMISQLLKLNQWWWLRHPLRPARKKNAQYEYFLWWASWHLLLSNESDLVWHIWHPRFSYLKFLTLFGERSYTCKLFYCKIGSALGICCTSSILLKISYLCYPFMYQNRDMAADNLIFYKKGKITFTVTETRKIWPEMQYVYYWIGT